ncbi:MAG: prepilin-type N-terminal cleavage/methylation domain-containing protein [Gemmatimonadetes bacterium]|nr:prepilin-type N-terminal cleavage/methylation domain-containing protein [Gemmatimonadota bacterium]
MDGHTLLELLTVLTLFGVGASAAAPTARRLADRAAVHSAREEVVALLGEARSVAMANGSGVVTFAADPPRARIESGTALIRSVDLFGDRDVQLVLGGARDSTVIRFDALGLGRFASETIVLTRGDVSATVVVSSYGRIRRR